MKTFPEVFFVMRTAGRGDGVDVMLCRKNGNRKKPWKQKFDFYFKICLFFSF